MTNLRARINRRQRGVSLAILLWFIAALSLLVAGMMYQARVDIKLAQLHVEQAQVLAAGDGAIQLAMAEFLIEKQSLVPVPGEFQSIPQFRYRMGDQVVRVTLYPASGLVGLNEATVELLTQTFTHSGGLEPGAAQQLAESVVEWRSPRRPGAVSNGRVSWPSGYVPRSGRLVAIEDLLLIPGVDRSLLDRLRDSVYVGNKEQSGVDWAAAPSSVLNVLAAGDMAAARSLANFRSTGGNRDAAPDGIDFGFQAEGELGIYRADAVVSAGGRQFLRRRWVDSNSAGPDGLPWQFIRTEPVRGMGG